MTKKTKPPLTRRSFLKGPTLGFVAGTITVGGASQYVFRSDDSALLRPPEVKIEKYYIRNFEKKEWLDAKKSYWIKSRAPTPMNYGYIAVPTSTKESITFETLLKVYRINRPKQ